MENIMEQAVSERVAQCSLAVNNIVWEFRRKFYQNNVLDVDIFPRRREYQGRSFYTYDLYVHTDNKETSRIRIVPNFKKSCVTVSILNKNNLIKAVEEGKRLSA